jgi:hypothetical protein
VEPAVAEIERRIAELQKWLQENDPECFTQQLHLNHHSTECVYWHYGYLVALRDIAALIESGHGF